MIRKFLWSVSFGLVLSVILALPVLAISNPDTVSFSCTDSNPVYKVFYNVLEADDMMFVAEQFIDYSTTPNETASDAFLFEVLNTAGNVTIASTGINQYGAKPVSIYLTATQVTAAGISVNDTLILRLTGNPLLFASPTNNTVTATLGSGDYVDQELGDDDGVATDNNLRNFLIGVVEDLEVADNTTYIAN